MGWDNENKIAILDEHIKSFDSSDSFESQITKPFLRKVFKYVIHIISSHFIYLRLVTLQQMLFFKSRSFTKYWLID